MTKTKTDRMGRDITYRPVFVYGTLRLPHGMDILRPDVVLHKERATLQGHRLFYAGSIGTFPYCVPGPIDSVTVGDLVIVDPREWRYTLDQLDQLESYWGPHYTSHYDRQIHPVYLPNGSQACAGAYVYVATNLAAVSRGIPVPGNDWIAGGNR